MVHKDRTRSHQIQENYPSHLMIAKPTTPYPAVYIFPHSSMPFQALPQAPPPLHFFQLSSLESLSEAQPKVLSTACVFCFSAPCFSKENAANPTLCSGRTGLRRDCKAPVGQGLRAGPRPTTASLPGHLGVPWPSRLAPEQSLHCAHQQVPPPSPYGAVARPPAGLLAHPATVRRACRVQGTQKSQKH